MLSLIAPDFATAPTTARPSFQWWNLRWAAALAAACLIAVVVIHRPEPVYEARVDVKVQRPNATAPEPMPTPVQPTSPVVLPKRKKFVASPVIVAAKPVAPSAQPVVLVPPDVANVQPPTDRIQTGQLIPVAPPPPPKPQSNSAALQALADNQQYSAAFRARTVRALPRLGSNLPVRQTEWKIGEAPGTLTSSEDGGSTLKTAHVDDRTNLYALSVSGFDIWAGGENGALFHSTDNGLHWSQVTVPVTDAITAIHTNGTIIRLTIKSGDWWSSDGGRTWATK